MAIKLAATFNTTAEFWLNAQKAVDLYKANLGLKNIALPKCINKKTKVKLEGSKVA
jgi:plasmid maintenance system antidote protein VapI